MRKRSKIRIPQDILPWARVVKLDDDSINIFSKIATNGISGNRRSRQTRLFTKQNNIEAATISKNFLIYDQRVNVNADYLSQYQYHFYKLLGKQGGRAKSKNFCLVLGKDKTFNRKYFISRQIMRKLNKTGLINGLQKR